MKPRRRIGFDTKRDALREWLYDADWQTTHIAGTPSLRVLGPQATRTRLLGWLFENASGDLVGPSHVISFGPWRRRSQ